MYKKSSDIGRHSKALRVIKKIPSKSLVDFQRILKPFSRFRSPYRDHQLGVEKSEEDF